MNTIPSAAAPVVELKKFKHSDFASDETECFEAIVCINGKPAFHARNEGTGGCDHYTPVEYTDAGRAAMADGMKLLSEHCATLPPEVSHGITLEMDVESFIAKLVHEELLKKDAAKLRAKMKNRFITVEAGKLRQTRTMPVEYMTPAGFELYAKRFPGVKLVNAMAREQQDAVFAQAVRGQPITA